MMRGHAAVSAVGLVLVLGCGARTTLEVGSGPTLHPGNGSEGGGSNADDNGASDGGEAPMMQTPPPVMPNPPPMMPSSTPMTPNPPPTPPSSRRIACGSTSCDSTTEDCCLQVAANVVVTCAPKGQCVFPGVSFSCSSAANCPAGQVCCLSQPIRGTPSAVCIAACGTAGGGFRPSIQLCDSPAECPTGTTCVPTPFGVSTCNPR